MEECERNNLKRPWKWWKSKHFVISLLFVSVVAVYVSARFLADRTPEKLGQAIEHTLLFLGGVVGLSLLDRLFLWREVAKTLRLEVDHVLRTHERIVSAARGCGITSIYPIRRDAAQDIRNDIRNAQKRVWILGVSLTREIGLNDLVSTLSAKKQAGVSIKILLMDAMSSPAVFRTILESPPATLKKMLRDIKGENARRIYRKQELCSDVSFAHDTLSRHEDGFLADNVRFYAHSAICWITIADNIMYYQPYSFGRGSRGDAADTIGPYLPVFRLEKTRSTYPFDVFEDHFDKLWRTSNTDLFQMGGRHADQERLLTKVFNNRRSWLELACHVLSSTDRRAHPRQETDQDPAPAVAITWVDVEGNTHSQVGVIQDMSCSSLRVKLEKGNPMPECGVGITVTLQSEECTQRTEATLSSLLEAADKELRVARTDKQAMVVVAALCALESRANTKTAAASA